MLDTDIINNIQNNSRHQCYCTTPDDDIKNCCDHDMERKSFKKNKIIILYARNDRYFD